MNVRDNKQVFGLTISTDYVKGEAIRYEMQNGQFSPAAEPLSAMTTQELEAISACAEADMTARQAYWGKYIPGKEE